MRKEESAQLMWASSLAFIRCRYGNPRDRRVRLPLASVVAVGPLPFTLTARFLALRSCLAHCSSLSLSLPSSVPVHRSRYGSSSAISRLFAFPCVARIQPCMLVDEAEAYLLCPDESCYVTFVTEEDRQVHVAESHAVGGEIPGKSFPLRPIPCSDGVLSRSSARFACNASVVGDGYSY